MKLNNLEPRGQTKILEGFGVDFLWGIEFYTSYDNLYSWHGIIRDRFWSRNHLDMLFIQHYSIHSDM